MTDTRSYYTTHSLMTDPGPYAYLYDDLPDDLEEIFQCIHHVLIHHDEAVDQYQPTSIQRREQFYRSMQQRLARIVELDPSPLTVPRSIKEKQIGYCRDFAVFMTSILRHKGYAARTRAGFGAYFIWNPPYRGDHWISEYWDSDQSRWRLIDAEFGGDDIDALLDKVKRPLQPGIDFADLRTNHDFYLAPFSWRAVRLGEIDVKLYRHNSHWRGWPMLRGNLLHDFQALNKMEMGIFDYWDDLHARPESEIKTRDKTLLDQVAEVCLDPELTFDRMRTLFEELPRTQVLKSRLHLIGILGKGDTQTASDLLESDLARLIEISAPSGQGQQFEASARSEIQASSQEQDTKIEDFDGIIIKGARQNNLKGMDVYIPRNKLVVITGVSGSGKSSLAFDTIYAEGQRRYVESLSSFARQFMRQMEKPRVDQVIGLNPAIAIEQHTISPNSRSTVGSITEVIDYLRILFARAGQMHCPQCGRAIQPQSAYQISRHLSRLPTGIRYQVLAPLNRYGQMSSADLLEQIRFHGCQHLRIKGEMLPADMLDPLHKIEDNAVEALVAEFTQPEPNECDHAFQSQLMVAIETAFELGKGILYLALGDEELRLSSENVCPTCSLALSRPEPRLLNPNTIFGMCLACNGSGHKLQVDPELIITKPQRSILDDASDFRLISNLRNSTSTYWINYIQGIADYYGADLEKPWVELPERFRRTLIYGTEGKKIHIEFGAESESGSFKVTRTRELDGAIHHINRLYRQTKSESSRRYYRQFMRRSPCPQCNGERLNKQARFITLANKRFPEIAHKSIGELLSWVQGLRDKLDPRQIAIGAELIAEVEERLGFICKVGLHYLTLDRPGPTLSGGEAQRIRLASQIGTSLKGVLYVLDEPSIGLHPRDHQALLDLLCRLRDNGNSVLVVEHDADTMLRADWLIDIGPGAGSAGGELVAAGTPAQIMDNPDSLTGKFLSGSLDILPENRGDHREPTGWLTLRKARHHNLKSIDVSFPLGVLVCITGVSGSGKSSLVTLTLAPALAGVLQNGRDVPGPHGGLEGANQLQRIVHITQEPIGRNPRSNPGTYVGVLNSIRKVFARTPLARERGYPEGHFSFNSKGGRCEACEGYGANKVKMHFMADIWVQCQECEGERFTPQVLEVRYRDKNITEVLDMDVAETCQFFQDHPPISRMLKTLSDVGLGYLKLGQNATTLSGGEAQRVKLAKELSRKTHGKTLYVLDEPTVGLHFADIQRLLAILNRLVETGNTVMVIEHNLSVIQAADWIIDLGPGGGEEGGCLVAEGTPERVASVASSYTGQFLKQALNGKSKLI